MKRKPLFHPRVFNEESWARGYFERNRRAIMKQGRRLAAVLRDQRLTRARVLDAGCGFGAAAVELARALPEVEVVGIDLSEPLLRIAGKLAAEADVSDRVHFMRRDVAGTDFPSGGFGVVLSMFMLHIVENPLTMLDELERLAEPTGAILITDLCRSSLAIIEKKLATAFTSAEALELIRRSRLRAGTMKSGFYWWDYFAFGGADS